jgi:hypothetical protein
MASLVVVQGDRRGTRIALPAGPAPIILGRSPDCTVVIPDQAVSRRHAQIVCEDGRYYIEDLRARSPAVVNSQAVATRTPLSHGDRIRVCDAVFRFEIDATAAESETDDGSGTIEDRPGQRAAALEALPADRLRALIEASTRLHAADAGALPAAAAEALLKLFPQAERAFVVLREEGSGRLVPKAVRTRKPPEPAPDGFSRAVARRCLDARTPLLSEDAVTDDPAEPARRAPGQRVRSVMGAPVLRPDGTAVAVLLVDTEDRARGFSAEELNLLTAAAEQAAVAFENARRVAEAARPRPAGRLSTPSGVLAFAGPPTPPPAPARPSDRWGRTAQRLREVRQRQLGRWGRVGSVAVGRFLTGEATPDQRRRVETDLRAHPELVELLAAVREAAALRRGVP